MIERLETILAKYNELNDELVKPEVISDIKKSLALSKEIASIRDVVLCYEDYKKINKEIEELEILVNDAEMGEFAKEELARSLLKKEELEKALEILLIPKDPNDGKNVIVEIRGAAGGDEGNIFAGDLFRMYTRYAETRGWHYEILESIEGTSGGYTQIEFLIKGDNVYSFLKYESGSHRVQRVPETESQGRVHTSTSTVLVMPEVEDIEVDIKEIDLKIDVYHSGGAGGQSVNTTDSAVRITHLPTNTVVTCQNERSQLKNKAKAMQILKARLYENTMKKHEEELGTERKNKIGTGDRSEKIRTYNYPQNRITDHRINYTLMQLDRVMEGDLVEILEALINEDQRMKLEGN